MAARAASATDRLQVTRKAELSGPCSASIRRSRPASRPSAVSSANTISSLGPAGVPVSMRWDTMRLAIATQGLPGPMILAQRGIVVVP